MLFASYGFLAFLLVVIIVYYLLHGKSQWMFLLAASYLFYWLSDPRYVVFIFATTVTIYFAALMIDRTKQKQELLLSRGKEVLSREEKKIIKNSSKQKERLWMLSALLINLGILVGVKYTNFAIANINCIRRLLGISGQIPARDILVPMGISFYTFQAVGYLLDVYFGRSKAERSLPRFMLFISFFPQLVQGPISRFNDLKRTLFEDHRFDPEYVRYGLQRVLWGYFKKLVVADRVLPAVNAIVHDPAEFRGYYVILGMLFYALELYADFTGGIDITLGIAQMMGIRVTENFERPYFSKTVQEYWKRWHITMGTWFTDYIFFPLSVSKPMQRLSKWLRKKAGNRAATRVPVYLSSFVVWFATGLWHGASWNFIVWGLGNFAILTISEELSPMYEKFHNRYQVIGKTSWKCFQVIRTVLLMSCLRMFDCYRDVPLTFRMFATIFSAWGNSLPESGILSRSGLTAADYIILVLATFLMFAVSMIQRSGCVRDKVSRLPFWGRYAVWSGLFFAVLMFGAYGVGYDESQFIYNQF